MIVPVHPLRLSRWSDAKSLSRYIPSGQTKGENMKSRVFSWIAVMSLFAPLAAPLRVIAQEEQSQTNRNRHYTVKDLGTLGGAYSFGYGR